MYYLNNLSKKVNENTVYYKSVTDISYILSVPRPSVSRSLHKLENSGKIKIYKQSSILFGSHLALQKARWLPIKL
mgnify:CR=1 FL=1